MAPTPLESYRALRESGRLHPDAAQARAASVLDALSRKLQAYRPQPRGFFGFARGSTEVPKGLYIHGDVGRGKSLLMDIFFESAPVANKRRIHFNAFMTETHQRIHEWRQMSARERARRPEFVKEAGEDPIAPVAKRISLEATLLCFDEFQVNDVADAMILGRLFERLFAFGVVVVLTSNMPPRRLYEGGLNRALFLPFIAMIEERMTALELNAARDFRLDRMHGMKVYITPLGPEAVLAEEEAVVAEEHDHRVVELARLLERLEQHADALVHRGHHAGAQADFLLRAGVQRLEDGLRLRHAAHRHRIGPEIGRAHV